MKDKVTKLAKRVVTCLLCNFSFLAVNIEERPDVECPACHSVLLVDATEKEFLPVDRDRLSCDSSKLPFMK